MRIYRIQDAAGVTHHAASTDSETFTRLTGSFPDFTPTGEPVVPAKILAPLQPPANYCIGLNYHKHAAEVGQEPPEHPVLFMKAPSAVTGPNDAIELPRGLASDKVDYEVELVVVIGRRGKNIPEEHALEHVFGYTVANDVSARDWQKHGGGGQWVRGKTFDTFCPLGPCIVTRDEIPDPNALGLRSRVNNELRQDASTADFIFSVQKLVSFLSGSTTLEPGTVILTGTPSGVGMAMNPRQFLKPGDVVTCEIDGIGHLENPVIEESL